MEEPGIRLLDSPERTTSGEGSADLERLLQTAEAENLQLLKLIDTEREKCAAFQNQIEEAGKHSEELEELTKNLDAQAKQLHNKFKQNRELCESLRKTALILDEHEEALRRKLEVVTLEEQTQILQQEKVMEKYEKTWEKYFKKYESLPLAIELSQIKQTAINDETCVKETTENITKIEAQIIEMEVEKTHMQEYLEGNPETVTDCIIKMAKLFLDVEKSAQTTREKLSELKSANEDFSAATEPESPAECESLHQEQTNGVLLHEKENRVVQQESDEGNQGTEIIDAEEMLQCGDSQFIGNKTGLADSQVENNRENNTVEMATVVSENQTNYTPRQLSTYSQMPLYQQQQQQHPVEGNGTTETLRQNSEPTSGNCGQNNGLPVISMEQPSPSHHQENQTEYPPNDTSDVQQLHKDPPASTNSKTPTTPISGSTTPVHQSEGTGTPIKSPLDLNQHMRFIRQVVKSPGEGFMYQGRPMYNSHPVQAEEPVQRNELPEKRNEPEIIYEAPLNDQPPDIALNFFQPFTHQTENNQNMFQTTTEPSPKRHGSMFLNSSPAKSGASRSPQNFSFGQCATSPSQSGSDNFMSSSSPKGFFTRNQPQPNNESFNAGFSLFGAGNSPGNNNNNNNNNEDTSGGFSFSFGAKSPSKSSNNSGFSLF